jgi:hypothetical protein
MLCGAFVCVVSPEGRASDGAYGRFQGDLAVGAEIGITETMGDESARGESMALRLSLLYLSTAGVFGQYNESFGLSSQPISRSTVAGVELRPFFLGRWAENVERGPAHLDLWLDSISLALGLHNLWRQERFCDPAVGCHDFGMELSMGMELPLLPQANSPFIALRGAVRWSLSDLDQVRPAPPPMGLITLTLGYHHLFETHLVDAGDTLSP